jgi:hypothetical protein
LINFGFKDVGAAVVGGMESNFGRAILWRCLLFKTPINVIDLSAPHREHISSLLRAQQVNSIHSFLKPENDYCEKYMEFSSKMALNIIYYLRSAQPDSTVQFFTTKSDYLFHVDTLLAPLKQPTQVPHVKFVDLHERKLIILSFCSYHASNNVRKAKCEKAQTI